MRNLLIPLGQAMSQTTAVREQAHYPLIVWTWFNNWVIRIPPASRSLGSGSFVNSSHFGKIYNISLDKKHKSPGIWPIFKFLCIFRH